jgi:hypothetical protein
LNVATQRDLCRIIRITVKQFNIGYASLAEKCD